jgi:hypothetical protein
MSPTGLSILSQGIALAAGRHAAVALEHVIELITRPPVEFRLQTFAVERNRPHIAVMDKATSPDFGPEFAVSGRTVAVGAPNRPMLRSARSLRIAVRCGRSARR